MAVSPTVERQPFLHRNRAADAAWIVEKSRAWSDCGGDVESRFTRDELLTNVMIYWITQSIGTSFLTYFDYANASAMTWMVPGLKNWAGSSTVPAALALFPADIGHPPRDWAERFSIGPSAFQCPALDRNAARQALCSDGRAGMIEADLRDWFRRFR